MGKKRKKRSKPTPGTVYEGILGRRGAKKLGVAVGTKVNFVLSARRNDVATRIRTVGGEEFPADTYLSVGGMSIVDVEKAAVQ